MKRLIQSTLVSYLGTMGIALYSGQPTGGPQQPSELISTVTEEQVLADDTGKEPQDLGHVSEPLEANKPGGAAPSSGQDKVPDIPMEQKVSAQQNIAAAPITRILPPSSSAAHDMAQTKKTARDTSARPSGMDEPRGAERGGDVEVLEDLASRSYKVQTQYVLPPDDSEELINFQFENTDLKNVIQQVGDLFNATFLTDDIISPLPQGQGAVATTGNKVSFRTQKPMTKKQAWNMFLSFLDIAGFNVVPGPSPRIYRVISAQKSLKAPEPAYIGVDPKTLPGNDQMIRYVYFVENGNMNVIQSVVDKLRSSTSDLVALSDAKAFILTDKAYNIKALMTIVKELDRVSIPQAMSVMKLYRADATDVKKLFDQLMGVEEGRQQPMFMPPRQQPTALYFAQSTRIIAEPRTNSLIILGAPESIEKIESFISKHVDKDPDAPHSPLFYYDLKFAQAKNVKAILENTVGKFGREPATEAGRVGGVRGTDKYVRPMAFIDDPATNRIIMKGDYQDYLIVKDLIAQIDQPQPQVAVEILVLLVSWEKVKKLGTQIRNYMKACGGFGSDKVQFQTSGIGKIVERQKTSSQGVTVAERLMGNLLDLVTALEAGNTIISLGRDIFGVWGIIRMLETLSASETVANPFILASNKQKAIVEVGETRRVVTAEIVNTGNSTQSYDNMDATLKVEVTPQINSDGMILLDLVVSLNNFVPGSTATNVALQNREIRTKAIVSDREVLALGGLIRNKSDHNKAKTPLLGDIPILGWLFKNENSDDVRDSLLVLFSTQIIDPLNPAAAGRFTQHHIDDYYGTLDAMNYVIDTKDPIYRMFFKEGTKSVAQRVQDFIFEKPLKRKKKERQVKKATQEKLNSEIKPATKSGGGSADKVPAEKNVGKKDVQGPNGRVSYDKPSGDSRYPKVSLISETTAEKLEGSHD
jgi:general secretion pathway protein D